MLFDVINIKRWCEIYYNSVKLSEFALFLCDQLDGKSETFSGWSPYVKVNLGYFSISHWFYLRHSEPTYTILRSYYKSELK